jgi:hypothetical protein
MSQDWHRSSHFPGCQFETPGVNEGILVCNLLRVKWENMEKPRWDDPVLKESTVKKRAHAGGHAHFWEAPGLTHWFCRSRNYLLHRGSCTSLCPYSGSSWGPGGNQRLTEPWLLQWWPCSLNNSPRSGSWEWQGVDLGDKVVYLSLNDCDTDCYSCEFQMPSCPATKPHGLAEMAQMRACGWAMYFQEVIKQDILFKFLGLIGVWDL